MGIPGLTTFMNVHYHWDNVRPTGGMVIDGHSLLYTIHEDDKINIDWIHGGQYWLLRKHLVEFFTSLLSSAIRPIVVMDGFDHTGQREQIKITRRQESLKEMIRNLLQDSRNQPMKAGRVVPILSQHVFTYVLKELDIPLYVTDGEADPVVVALANHYHYPVVGNDSDYFMFNIEHGYIPINRLNWEMQPVKADMYKLTGFISDFGINDCLSKVIPSIMGCDYIDRLVPTFIEEGVLSTVSGDVVASLVRYIFKMENVEELLRHIKRTLNGGKTIANSLVQNIQKAEEIYNIKGTISEEQLLHDSVLESRGIPQWVLDQYRRGNFSSYLLNGVVLGRVIGKRGIIDNPNNPRCAMSVCLRIEESMFTILSPLMKSNKVTVFTRVGHKLSQEVLKFSMNSQTLPTIHSIAEKSREERIVLLCKVAEVDPSVLEPFDDEWKLVVASTCYWVKNCNPRRDLIIALLKTFLYCHRLTSAVAACSTEYDVLMSLPNMRRTNAWLDTLHVFTSFQCIYYNMINLNELLQSPLPSLSPAFIFDGKFALMYAYTDDLEKMLRNDFVKDYPLYDLMMRTMVADHIPP